MPELSGLSFGGNVWSYGSLAAFEADYKAAQAEFSGQRPADGVEPDRSNGKSETEPVDTGLTRYLSNAGNMELKWANLKLINASVAQYRLLHDGALPEEAVIDMDKDPAVSMVEKVFPNLDADEALKVLGRMLEKKVLATRTESWKATDGTGCAPTLTDKDRETIADCCRTALCKALRAAAVQNLRLEEGSRVVPDRQAVLNSALGLAELLLDGRIDADAIVMLVNDGSLLDLTNNLDVTAMLKRTADEAVAQFTNKAALDRLLRDHPGDAELARLVGDYRDRTKSFTAVLDFKIAEHDPDGKADDVTFLRQQLQDAKLRLQQFRFDLERCTGDVGKEFGHCKYGFYGLMERLRRVCSNRFARDRHLKARFSSNADRRERFGALRAAQERLSGYLEKNGLASLPTVADGARTACAATHAANDGARFNQAIADGRRAWNAYGGIVLERLRRSGGMRMVSTDISAACLASVGARSLANASAAFGGFVRTSAVLAANKNGAYRLTLTKVGGVRGGVTGGVAGGTGTVEASGEGSHGEETVLTFTDSDELLVFCRQHAPKLLQSIPGALIGTDEQKIAAESLPRLHSRRHLVERLGKFLGSALGLRIHKAKNFCEVGFEKRLRDLHVYGALDAVLFEKKNPLARLRTTQQVTSLDLKAKAAIGLAKTGASKDTLSVAGDVALAERHHAVTKALQSVTEAFAPYSVREMEPEVRKEYERFRQYLADLPPAATDMAAKIMAFAEARPPESADAEACAAFWNGKAHELNGLYAKFENQFATSWKQMRKLGLDRFFAHTTRFFAVVGEYLAKQIGETSVRLKETSSAATQNLLRTSEDLLRYTLGVRLSRPSFAFDCDLFQRVVQFGSEIKAGRTVEIRSSLEVGWDLNVGTEGSSGADGGTSAGLMDAAMETFKSAFATAIPKQHADFGAQFLRQLVGQQGRVMGKFTGQFHTGASEIVQPWRKTDSLTFDLEVDHPLAPVQLLKAVIALVSRAKAAKAEGAQTLQTCAAAAVKELATELARQAAATALGQVDKSVGTILMSSPLGTIPAKGAMSGLNAILGLAGFGLLDGSSGDVQTSGGKLTLKFEGGRFATCRYSECVQNATSLSLKAKTPFCAGLTITKRDVSRQELVEFETLPNPSFSSLLSRCADLLSANGKKGPAEVAAFLRSNQGAVNKLVRELRNAKTEGRLVSDDPSLQGLLTELPELKAPAGGTRAQVRSARAAHAALFGSDGAWARLVRPPAEDEDDARRVELMTKLTIGVVKAYGLLGSVR